MKYSFTISIVLIFVFIMQKLFAPLTDFFIIDHAKPFEIWRYFTAIFIHGSLLHLILNLFGLLLFGFILEHEIGSKRFLIVFLATGIFSSIVSVFFYDRVLGASGAIFGIIGVLTILRPGMSVWAYSVPMPLFIASILWVTADVLGIVFPKDNIANIGHISGLAVGVLIGLYLRIKNPRIKTKKDRINIPEEYVREWERRYVE